MGGLTLARLIKTDPLLAGTSLVVLTSLSQSLTPTELGEAGLHAYLVKPVKQSRLFDCLFSALAGYCKYDPPTRLVPGRSQVPAAETSAVAGDKGRILLAEDNAVNQKVALAQLRKLSYRANAVANGLEVLEALRQVPYEVILMDCQMPEVDGYEATRAIRQAEQAEDCPWKAPVYIIAMTANAMEGDREKCAEAGMDDYLSKPVRTAELQAALQRWERVSRQLQANLGAN